MMLEHLRTLPSVLFSKLSVLYVSRVFKFTFLKFNYNYKHDTCIPIEEHKLL